MFNRLKNKFNRCLIGTGLNRAASLLLVSRGRRRTGAGSISMAEQILVLKPDGIGDVILVTGFLRSLRQQCPRAHITIAVRQISRELVAHSCFADEVMIWKEEWCGMTVKPRSTMDLIESARSKWKSRPLDWVLIPRSGWDHANASMYAWGTGAPNICAHECFCSDRGLRRHGFVNHLVPTVKIAHETEFHRHMLQFLKLDSEVNPQIEITPPARMKIIELFSGTRTESKTVALGVGANHGSRRWPADNFKTLAQDLVRKWPGITIYLIGGMDDHQIARLIMAETGGAIIDVAGKLSILETAALLQRCDLFIGNDSGPVHLAGAVGCMVVQVSKHPVTGNSDHESSPVRFGPVARWSCVLQPIALRSECKEGCNRPFAHCIANITPSQVMNSVCHAFTQVEGAGAKNHEPA